MSRKLAVSIDYGWCGAHGVCHASLPGVFGEDEEGRGVVKQAGVATASEAELNRAAALCPANAIAIAAVPADE
jgi:ferredoxin